MENNRALLGEVKRTFQECGWTAQSVSTPEDADDAARQGTRYFVLDVDMGRENPRAGLTALEMLKGSQDPTICVAVYSSYLMRLEEELDEHISPDIAVKKGGPAEIPGDCARIIEYFLDHQKQLFLKAQAQFVSRFPMAVDSIYKAPSVHLAVRNPFTRTVNSSVLDELNGDPAFIGEHLGRYVALVDGSVRSIHDKREEALAELRALSVGVRMIARIGPPLVELNFPGVHGVNL